MNIQEILALVKRPGRYIGREKNAWCKPWEKALGRICCIFPDLYEIGMSHQGLLILYDIINRTDYLLADRCYCPDKDLENLLRENRLPLTSLESKRPLDEFDILAITLPYELCYTNILTMLSLCGIPLWNRERSGLRWPIVLGGGSCCLNPEPVADFFDAILIGDGEEALPEIASVVVNAKTRKTSKIALLKRLSTIRGLYIPAFYKPIYFAGKVFGGMKAMHGAPTRVKRRIVPELSADMEIQAPLVPNIRTVHDRLGIEIARGCTRGCRYCQATTIYRPVREKSVGQIMASARAGFKATGWEEISLLSLSTGDYSAIGGLITRFMDEFVPRNCSVSLPSLRVGTLTPEIMDQIIKIRKTGITLAPEAGSERLRRVINKGITEEALMETARQAFERGWKKIKLYFMIGLPSETYEDVLEIVELVKRVREQARFAKRPRGGVQVTASIGTFVPKPETPFQWEKQIGIEEARKRLGMIKRGLRGKAYRVKWHDPRQSFLEGVFSRGNRHLSMLVHKAWTMGARLDAWTDNLRIETFQEAAETLGIDLSSYLSEMGQDDILYWDHIDSGIKKSFLRLEKRRALKASYTPDCRYNDCQGCGVCDFKTTKNVLKGQQGKVHTKSSASATDWTQGQEAFFYRVEYEKLFDARFIGHLDMVRMFHRAIRRAGLPVSYSKGFHPMPRVSFENPIPLGMESMREHFIMELRKTMDPGVLCRRLQEEMIPGIGIKNVAACGKGERLLPAPVQTYWIMLPVKHAQIEASVGHFMSLSTMMVEISRKKKRIKTDIRKAVRELRFASREEPPLSWIKAAGEQFQGRETSMVELVLEQCSPTGLRPRDILFRALSLDERTILLSRCLKA